MPTLDRSTSIDLYTAAWAETDRARQQALLARCWTPDTTYEDPQTPAVRGTDALLAVIAGFHQAWPGARISLNSAVEEYRQVGRFNWILQQPTGSTTYGTDFVEFNDQNQLIRVVGFFSHLARWQPEEASAAAA
jgi:hypothetical protein